MLNNAYFLANIGADTAENERNFAKKLATTLRLTSGHGPERLADLAATPIVARSGPPTAFRTTSGPSCSKTSINVEVKESNAHRILRVFRQESLFCSSCIKRTEQIER